MITEKQAIDIAGRFAGEKPDRGWLPKRWVIAAIQAASRKHPEPLKVKVAYVRGDDPQTVEDIMIVFDSESVPATHSVVEVELP
jgi:hypothetical protein